MQQHPWLFNSDLLPQKQDLSEEEECSSASGTAATTNPPESETAINRERYRYVFDDYEHLVGEPSHLSKTKQKLLKRVVQKTAKVIRRVRGDEWWQEQASIARVNEDDNHDSKGRYGSPSTKSDSAGRQRKQRRNHIQRVESDEEGEHPIEMAIARFVSKEELNCKSRPLDIVIMND